MMDVELVIVPDPQALAREAAQRFTSLAVDAVESRGRFSVALSGGSTPGALYRLLAEEPYQSHVPWAQVHLFWAAAPDLNMRPPSPLPGGRENGGPACPRRR